MKVALTFDDGPSEHTTRILNTLQLCEARVSFFVMGSKVEQHRGKIYRQLQMGCDILCHAWEHQDFTELKKRAIRKQLLSTAEAIKSVTGNAPPPIFRPPYGNYNEVVEKLARKLGLSMVNWSIETKDWDHKDADKICSIINDNVKDGDVILCHDVYESTADAMSRVIPDLIAKGYELVTITELIRERFGKFEPGKMYFDTTSDI